MSRNDRHDLCGFVPVEGFTPITDELRVLARHYVDELDCVDHRIFVEEHVDTENYVDGDYFCQRLKEIQRMLGSEDFHEQVDPLGSMLLRSLEQFKAETIKWRESDGVLPEVQRGPICLQCQHRDQQQPVEF